MNLIYVLLLHTNRKRSENHSWGMAYDRSWSMSENQNGFIDWDHYSSSKSSTDEGGFINFSNLSCQRFSRSYAGGPSYFTDSIMR